jgi:hypothetical protein
MFSCSSEVADVSLPVWSAVSRSSSVVLRSRLPRLALPSLPVVWSCALRA